MTVPSSGARRYSELEVGGRTVRISTPERVLWPGINMTKAQLIDYYIRASPVLLPHLAGRPVVLGRFPYGVDGKGFFQIRTPPHPEWVRTQHMYVFTAGKDVEVPVIDDLPGLVWAANLSSIELHPYLGRNERLGHPDYLVFDFDPGPPADLLDACRVALRVREMLDALGLTSFVKTSGAKGLHVYVPTGGLHEYAQTKAFARALAALIVRDDPTHVVDRVTRHLRPGKVFVDWGQNDASKSMAVAYSVRARELPMVSTPVQWAEVEQALAAGDWRRLVFGPGEVLDRIATHGDLFADTLTMQQRLPALP